MDLESMKETFFAECVEQLAELEAGLFALCGKNPDLKIINSVFRAVHSIKGGAGAFAFDDLVSFAHVFENALDLLRTDISETNEDRIQVLLRASDTLADVVASVRDGSEPLVSSEVEEELVSVFALDDSTVEDEIEFEAVPISLDNFDFDDSVNRFTITFEPFPELYLQGDDPQKIFRELADFGVCEVIPNIDDIKNLEELDIKMSNLSWTIKLETSASEFDVKAPFEWVEEHCDYSVELDESQDFENGNINIEDFLSGETFGSQGDKLCEDELYEAPALHVDDEDNLAAVLSDEEPMLEVTRENNQTVVSEAAEKESTVPLSKTENVGKKTSKPIRVDSDKVDHLINLMGEMVISQSMLTLQINQEAGGRMSPTAQALNELQGLTRNLQSRVMVIRAQPIKPVFMRMSRVVREVSAATGKKASLVLVGENTEVDTTVIEGLSDPLTHMIRNSVDHGIESAAERLELGKPEQGVLRLSASHGSGNILIEVADDGAGINREKVLEVAIKKGVVKSADNLTDEEIDNLIFAPGFSTSDEITDVSGRGVGMDVVRQSIQSLGGKVSITSSPGKGSVFSLQLPLTLAILEGMLVTSANQTLVLPISSIVETMVLNAADVLKVADGQQVFKLRGELVPLVDIGSELGFQGKQSVFDEGTVVVVESANNEMSAFIVDSIVGHQQVVIKNMEANYQRIPNISAATILGNGQIALILDVDAIVSMDKSNNTKHKKIA